MTTRNSRSRGGLRLRTAAAMAAAAAAAFTLANGPIVQAQIELADIPTLPAQRAQTLADAAVRDLGYVPGEVLVKFKAGVEVTAQRRALSAVRGRPDTDQLRAIGDLFRLTDVQEADATVLAAQLSAQPEVEYAEPNYLYHLHLSPTDAGFARQWNFTAIDLPTAWDINGGGSPDIVVAVVDSGVTSVSQTFAARTWNDTAIEQISVPYRINPDLSPERLFRPRDILNGSDIVLDMVGHGTHVASTIGEDQNAIAQVGVAYRTSIMPVKVCFGYWDLQFALSAAGIPGAPPPGVGGCDVASVVAGVRYAADNGADVINLSLGGPGQSAALRDAIAYAVGRGAFVAIAMGNEFDEGNPTEYPAADAPAIDGAVAVGAVGRSLRRAYYSNTGNHIEIAAPGGDVTDGGADGVIWQASLYPPDFDVRTVTVPRFDRYAEVANQGTSMAAPHVAGLAALLMDQGVNNPAAIEALLKRTARRLGTADAARPGWNSDFGYGLIQPRAALRGFAIAR